LVKKDVGKELKYEMCRWERYARNRKQKLRIM